MRGRLTPELLFSALRMAWDRDTSGTPDEWRRSNPAEGQCAVSALVVQDYFGGRLRSGMTNGYLHYWNVMPDGTEWDTTAGQFGEIISHQPVISSFPRALILSNPQTRLRYHRLALRVCSILRYTRAYA